MPVGQAERKFVVVLRAPWEEADVELLARLQAQVHGERELLNAWLALLRLAQIGARIEILAVSTSHAIRHFALERK